MELDRVGGLPIFPLKRRSVIINFKQITMDITIRHWRRPLVFILIVRSPDMWRLEAAAEAAQ